MASRKPGPTCVTNEPPFDNGTLCRSQSPLPGPTGSNVDAAESPASITAKNRKLVRLVENKKYLEDKNVKAFLQAIGAAEGGDYNLKYGGVKGKNNDRWQFTDFSTHPGAGADGKTTAAGMYQINRDTWREMGSKMGLTDFSSSTQDLLAVEILRSIRVIDAIVSGDIDSALAEASRRWAALPEGPGKPGRYAQPYMKYSDFVAAYKQAGGKTK